MRWFIAELMPFGCIAAGFAIAGAWHPILVLGYMLAVFGSYILSLIYLYKVLGAAIGWVLALVPQIVGITGIGAVVIVGSATTTSPQHPGGVKTLPTSSWWIAGACLAVTLAVTVIAAVINGERWLQRNRHHLPRNKFEAFGHPRGTLARLWLPDDRGR
ncbi:MAG TPA: hypothetical protein VF070_20240 [Streptosporangiaceae bacterium]